MFPEIRDWKRRRSRPRHRSPRHWCSARCHTNDCAGRSSRGYQHGVGTVPGRRYESRRGMGRSGCCVGVPALQRGLRSGRGPNCRKDFHSMTRQTAAVSLGRLSRMPKCGILGTSRDRSELLGFNRSDRGTRPKIVPAVGISPCWPLRRDAGDASYGDVCVVGQGRLFGVRVLTMVAGDEGRSSLGAVG